LAAESNAEDLAFVKELLETGKVVPVSDRRYPLSEVADAVRHYGEGAPGKVVISVALGDD
jgi:NADPH:quinone reductase-like Zn-dependent oxidoreductase